MRARRTFLQFAAAATLAAALSAPAAAQGTI